MISQKKKKIASSMICFLLLLLLPIAFSEPTRNLKGISARAPTVQQIRNRHGAKEVMVDNGIFKVTFSSPQGLITGIKYKGIDNVLNPYLQARGYWDVTWQKEKENIRPNLDRVEGTKFRIITQNEKQVEISFSRKWKGGFDHIPLNVDKRYIIRTNTSGIYTYGMFERLPQWPAVEMGLIRVAFKLNPDRFHYMVVADDRQRQMPRDDDRDIHNGRAKALAYKEAVQLIKPHNPMFKNQVDDKYQYTCEVKDNMVHGWISTKPNVGFWLITPSTEYRSGGPVKQELTSHVGPTTLTTFISEHYVGTMDTNYRVGEAWKKVLGPVFIYLNSDSTANNPQHSLWEDAKRQAEQEVEAWPYDFVASSDFPTRQERGTITGRLFVNDGVLAPAGSAYVGLAPPGEAGSWQTNTKGYQFWTQTNETGYFTIDNVRRGTYNLYGWVTGFIGDFKYQNQVNVAAGSEINLDRIVFQPPRNGPTLWEIGVPDRTAREYFIPEPYTNTMNPLYLNHADKFRQYGLWQRYTELYPNHDLVYTVGVSKYSQDWFYAHVTRNKGDSTFVPTTWQIVFQLPHVNWRGSYTLQLALASAARANLHVRFNDEYSRPLFSTGNIGRDNAIARHGIHGAYRLYTIDVPGSLLRTGTNTIYLRQAKAVGPFEGLMYDYIRLEGPSSA